LSVRYLLQVYCQKAQQILRYLKKSETNDFYPKNLHHVLMPKPDFEGCRSNAKICFNDNQYLYDLKGHHMPGHPCTFMNMMRQRSRAVSAANDEKRQLLPRRVI
jgi:hypothetical protein